MFLTPGTLPTSFRRTVVTAACALLAAATAPSPISAGPIRATPTRSDPCSYLTDSAAGAALRSNVRHAKYLNELCVYSDPTQGGALAFLTVVKGKSALPLFAELLRLTGHRSEPITDLGDAAYSAGAIAFTLRGDTLIVAHVARAAVSRAELRTASIELARDAARSEVADSSTCVYASAGG